MNTQSQTESADQLRLRARQLVRARQMSAAQDVLERLVERMPGDAATRMELARVMLWRGHVRASVEQLLALAAQPPDDPGQLMQLCEWLFYGGETCAARASLDRLEARQDLSPKTQVAAARLRWMIGEVAQASDSLDKATASGPVQPPDMFLKALLKQYLGQNQAAEETLASSLERWPDFADPAVLRSNLRRQTPESNHVDDLRRRLDALPRHATHPGQHFMRAQFESALFKELDDLGRNEEAWQALERCNALMRRLAPYHAAGESAVTEAVLKASAELAEKAEGAPVDHDGPMPIFIVGMPRSGTTLLDRMLSSHSQVISAGELNDMQRQLSLAADMPASDIKGLLRLFDCSPKADVAELGARYLRQTQWRARGRRYFIDKLPGNIRMVHFIRLALPQARILHMVRDPMDVCYSNLKMMFGCTPAYSYSYGQAELADYHGHYRRLVAHWHACLPGAMLDVPYADLVRDPEAALRSVLAHCGLEMEADCLNPERNRAPVPTPDSGQLRQPIHTRGLGGWKRYAEALEPLRKALA